MKLINNIVCAAVLLLGGTACTNEAEGVMNEAVKDTELDFQLAVEQLQSRGSHTDATTITDFGITIKNKNNDPAIAQKYSYDNVKVAKVDGKWVPEKIIYLHGDDALDIVTFSPYQENGFEASSQGFTVEQVPSKTSYKSDFLSCQALAITPNSTDTSKEMYFQDGKLVMAMKHLMAQLTLVLNIDASMNLTEADLQNCDIKIRVLNGIYSFKYPYTPGEGWKLTNNGTLSSYFFYPYLDAVDNAEKVTQATYKCIVAQGKTLNIIMNIGGKSFKWKDTGNQIQLTSGQNTTLTLQLTPKKEGTQTASVSRSAWGD